MDAFAKTPASSPESNTPTPSPEEESKSGPSFPVSI
jgi:hypothetical protein